MFESWNQRIHIPKKLPFWQKPRNLMPKKLNDFTVHKCDFEKHKTLIISSVCRLNVKCRLKNT